MSSRGRGRRNRSKRNSNGRSGGSAPDGKGDIPLQKNFDLSTVSCRIPRTTQQVTFRQLLQLADVTQNNAAPVTNTYYFTLGALDQASTFVSLFDQYRIDAIRFIMKPYSNAVQVPTASTTSFQGMYNVIDYDNSTALGSTLAARQYDNCMETEPYETWCRVFRPRIAMSAYNGSFAGYANMQPEWIDCANSDVRHYGIKLYLPPCTASQAILQSWNVQVEYFISFRSMI